MVSMQSSLQRDENGMTAVIEFLAAFTLFLMILTAFLSLAQLEMGSNDTSVDRLDRAAAQGLDRMTSDGGWFVPVFDDGSLDYGNSTSHMASLLTSLQFTGATPYLSHTPSLLVSKQSPPHIP